MRLYRINHDDGPRWARTINSETLAVYSPSLNLTDIVAGRRPDAGEVSLEDAELLAPVERPGKIVCVGVNYLDHCRETNIAPPDEPLLFAKFPSIVSGPGAVVSWSAELTSQVDYEAELVVTIGRRARNVPVVRALEHVAGYMCGNDLSARDLQMADGQWIRGKNLDGFCAVGPCLVTADEVPDPQALAIECRVNGDVMQSSNTSEMIFGVAQIISYCSQHFTLEPGDIIMTGTPHGVALGRTPSPWLKGGDEVVVNIEGLGDLITTCEMA